MKIEIRKITLLDATTPPKLEVFVGFTDGEEFARKTGTVTVVIDEQNLTISEVKEQATEATRKFLYSVVESLEVGQ